MVKFVVVHRLDQNNVGDMASNPLQYFLKPDQYRVIDAANFGRVNYPLDVPLILGGGGLIGNEFIGNVAAKVLSTPDRLQVDALSAARWQVVDDRNQDLHRKFKNTYTDLLKEIQANLPVPSAPRYIWGAGQNSSAEEFEYPEEMKQFDRVGIRDFGQYYEWAPCASCMHPAFNKTYSIRNPVIWFEHKKQLIKDKVFGSESIPRFVNSGANIEQTIELLGSAEVVLTNSYHGAYWATLLKRKVIVVGAWSSKFKHLKHQPAFVDTAQDWKDAIDNAVIHNDALDECQSATREFWEAIQ
jgi:hypothetical protein